MDATDLRTARSQCRATTRPHAAPMAQKSVPSSPRQVRIVPSSPSSSAKVSTTCGTGPRTTRKSMRSGGCKADGLDSRRHPALDRREVRGEDHVRTALPHLERALERSRSSTEIRGCDHVEHDLTRRRDREALALWLCCYQHGGSRHKRTKLDREKRRFNAVVERHRDAYGM